MEKAITGDVVAARGHSLGCFGRSGEKVASPRWGGSAKYLLYFSKDICLAALIFFCPPRGQPDLRARLTSYLIPGFTLLAVGTMVSLTKGFSLVGGILSLRSLVLLPLACIFLISRLRTLSLPLIAMVVASFTLINASVATIQHSSAPDDPIT